MSEPNKMWKPGREPWCWQPKVALRRIRDALDADNAVSSGLLVYVALTEIASDKQSQTFQTTHGYIAGRTGLSPRTVQKRIQDLTSIGVLKCVVPTLRAPASYTLLTVEQNPIKQSFPNVQQPLHSEAQALLNDKQPLHSVMQRSNITPLPTLEESSEKSGNNKAKNPNKPIEPDAAKLTPHGAVIIDLIEKCRSIFGNEEMKRPDCHRRWYERAVTQPEKLNRVLAETRSALVESKIKTTPAQYAEYIWKEFK